MGLGHMSKMGPEGGFSAHMQKWYPIKNTDYSSICSCAQTIFGFYTHDGFSVDPILCNCYRMTKKAVSLPASSSCSVLPPSALLHLAIT